MRTATRMGLALVALATPALSAAEPKPTYAPLREAVSSLGAVAADGCLYVYGGHTGRPHQYSTETISGKFRRLNLLDGSTWEELPAPACRG